MIQESKRRIVMTLFTTLNSLLCDIRDTIVVAGSPRSGTTWVAEVIAKLLGHGLLNEPLHLHRVSEARRAGFEWRTYVAPNEKCPEKEDFMRKCLTGQITLMPRYHGQDGLQQLWWLRNHKFVVKFVRANRLLGWLSNTFPVKGVILLLRHPCAVIASQIRMGERENSFWKYASPPDEAGLQGGFLGWLPGPIFQQFEHVLRKIKTREEYLAALWCLDTWIPLHDGRDPRWTICTYENLVMSCESEFSRICRAMGVPELKLARNQVRLPAASASPDFRHDKRHQLGKWKEVLTKDQVKEILDVVKQFNLTFYNDDVEPHYEELKKLL
jgi:hypothetical protein